eukprot:1176486-Rhodomonas_salina.2
MEVDVVKGHAALDAVGRDDAAVVVDTGHAVEELEDAHRGADRLHELREDGEQRLERKDRLEREEHVRDEVAGGDDAGKDHLASVPQREQDAGVRRHRGDRAEAARDPRTLLGHEVGHVDLVRVVLDLSLLRHERAHGTDVVKHLSRLGSCQRERRDSVRHACLAVCAETSRATSHCACMPSPPALRCSVVVLTREERVRDAEG